MRSFFRKLGWLLRRGHREDDLQAELRFHLEETAEERRMEGAAPQDAEWAARRDLGSVAAVQEDMVIASRLNARMYAPYYRKSCIMNSAVIGESSCHDRLVKPWYLEKPNREANARSSPCRHN